MDKKKISERHLLTKFISNPELNLRVTSIIDSETPDFIVKTTEKRISIELTSLINPDLRQVEAYRNKIIKQAENRFKERYNEDLYMLVTFDNIALNGGKESEHYYASELFNSIEQLYLTNRNFEFDITLKKDKRISDFIRHLHVTNRLGFNNWQHFGAHRVDWVKMEWLTKRIRTKEKNISKYKETFDENWLLLISNFGTKSSAHRFDFLDFKTIETEFEKIFVYKYMENATIKIK